MLASLQGLSASDSPSVARTAPGDGRSSPILGAVLGLSSLSLASHKGHTRQESGMSQRSLRGGHSRQESVGSYSLSAGLDALSGSNADIAGDRSSSSLSSPSHTLLRAGSARVMLGGGGGSQTGLDSVSEMYVSHSVASQRTATPVDMQDEEIEQAAGLIFRDADAVMMVLKYHLELPNQGKLFLLEIVNGLLAANPLNSKRVRTVF